MGRVTKKRFKNVYITEEMVIENDPPPPKDELRSVNTVDCITSPVQNPSPKIQEIIDITGDYDFEIKQASSSKIKDLNIINNIIDITESTSDNELEQINIALSPSDQKTYSDDGTIDLTDSSDNELIQINSAILPSDQKKNDDNPINITNSNNNALEQIHSTILPSEKKKYNDGDIISQASRVHENPIELIVLDSDDEKNIQGEQSTKKSNCHYSKTESLGISDLSKKAIQKMRNKTVSYHKQLLNVVNSKLYLDKFGVYHQYNVQISNNVEQIVNVSVPSVPPQLSTASPYTTLMTARQLRPIYIDGLNIGHAYGYGTFSAKGIELCINYFTARGHTDILVFIPHHRRGPPGSLSNAVLNNLYKKGHVCYTPSRKINELRMTCYDDRILLNQAVKFGAVVVSNDNFRDLYPESAAFREIIETRHVMVTFARDEIIVPDDQYNRGPYSLKLSDILCFPA